MIFQWCVYKLQIESLYHYFIIFSFCFDKRFKIGKKKIRIKKRTKVTVKNYQNYWKQEIKQILIWKKIRLKCLFYLAEYLKPHDNSVRYEYSCKNTDRYSIRQNRTFKCIFVKLEFLSSLLSSKLLLELSCKSHINLIISIKKSFGILWHIHYSWYLQESLS